ncbi:hypothetical protein PRK78_004881 [Emydomyces testavorans]|uniref:Tachykinin family protein n=1 Tax=Emydomyces testavorans TaxID=2070801 RepID=A0AAF0DII4_9EURO|nr:hypothetical protein PRK78_004881 [Emydomyces testavorans]
MDQHSKDESSRVSGHTGRQGHCSRKPNPAHDLQSFTFIDHDNLASKRIKDAKARKTIRSHVMRDVRRRERLAGLKRVSKRDKKGKIRPGRQAAESDSQTTRSSSTPLSDTGSTTLIPVRSRRPPLWNPSAAFIPNHLPSPSSEPGAWQVDPFSTLACSSDTKPFVDRLMKYLMSVMLPMTFPVEAKNPLETRFRVEVLIESALTEPGPLFSNLSLAAAHKAILRTEKVEFSKLEERIFPNPDLYFMKAHAIKEMNKKLQDPETATDDAAFDIVVFLISAAVTLGLFSEARMHFEGLKKMVHSRGGIYSPSFEGTRTLGGVVMCDVKIAGGLLVRPFYPITWDMQPVPPHMKNRIFPHADTMIASKLRNSPYLSDTLKAEIEKIREMIFFESFNREDPVGLTREEHEFFRLRVHELEHELLDYPYRIFKKTGSGDEIDIPPIENVTRLACLGYISYNCVVAPPNSGVGRAITNHIKVALAKCAPDKPTRLVDDLLDILAWAAFVGVQSAGVQLERPWFLHQLRYVTILRGWKRWSEVEKVICGYIYAPDFHSVFWRKIWEEAISSSMVMEEE